MPERVLSSPTNVIDIICDAGFAPSRSQARRLVQQKAVRLGNEPIAGTDTEIEIQVETVLQVRKRRFLRLMPRQHYGQGAELGSSSQSPSSDTRR